MSFKSFATTILQIISPKPPKRIVKFITSLKKHTPIIVVKISFEKSKGIIFVIDEMLIALVQQKFPIVPIIARENSKTHKELLSGMVQTKDAGISVNGVINMIIKIIIEETDSVLVRSLTIKPTIAWENEARSAIKVPKFIPDSGCMITIVNKKPTIKHKITLFVGLSLKNIILPKKIKRGVVKLIDIAWVRGIKV